MLKFFLILVSTFSLIANDPYYFCTAANSSYFKPLLTLIGGIHRYHYDQLGQIAVFDLGLTSSQIRQLEKIEKLIVLQVEKKNPDVLTVFSSNLEGKTVPGWYSWKPVCIKMALDRYPDILWIDAGTTVFNPLDNLFTYIRKQGYFFHNGSVHSFSSQCTNYVKEKYNLYSEHNQWILDDMIFGMECGIMGITKKIYEDFVFPIYEIAADIRSFEDDGSAEGGFGHSRHDQTIFSMIALLNGYKIHYHYKKPLDVFYLDDDSLPFHIASCSEFLTTKTNLCSLRKKSGVYKHRSFIIYKN